MNNSPATVTSTVTGSTSNTQSQTMSFSQKVTNSITISIKNKVEAKIPEVADISTETTVSTGFEFEFSESQSATQTTQTTLSQSIQVSVPPFSNITVDMVLASQVRPLPFLLQTLNTQQRHPQDNVAIPFTAQLYASAYDWMANSNARTYLGWYLACPLIHPNNNTPLHSHAAADCRHSVCERL